MPNYNPSQFHGFEPSSEDIYAQFRRPPGDAVVNPRTLTPFLRVLLEIDGTVTRFIEAFTQEGIAVLKLGQGRLVLPDRVDFLEMEAGLEVTTRQVLLWGRESRRIYAYGSSLIVPERLSEEARRMLAHPQEGLGRIMRKTRMETYREILWKYREYTDVLPEAIRPLASMGLVSRTYRILCGGKPIMAINEKFPRVLDLPDHH
ncbi:MAG TPA: chorismate pyruvate-lyase family protein [Acidobacteriota bacterium]|nr:chorismate pyruvate-lyase family protein [Acidobacteriota bacterium]